MKEHLFILMLFFSSTLFVNAQTTVKGKVTDLNGKILKKANVTVTSTVGTKSLDVAEVDNKGNFKITLKDSSYFVLLFTGVNHQIARVPMFIEKPSKINMSVKLAEAAVQDSLPNVMIVGDFNDFDYKNPVPMQKQSNGTFTSEFETAQDTFAYQILEVQKNGQPISGSADYYVYDNNGGYKGVQKTKNGKVKIVFNPADLAQKEQKNIVKFDERETQKIYDIASEMDSRLDMFKKEAMKTPGKMPEIDWNKEVADVTKRLENEKDPKAKKLLYLDYLELVSFGAKDFKQEIVKQAFSDVDPGSIMWALNPTLLSVYYAVEQPSETDYLEKVIAVNPDRDVVAFVLLVKTSQAKYMGDNDRALTYYNKLMKDYGDTEFGTMAKRIPMNTTSLTGSKVPSFSVVSYDDSSVTFTNESLKEKFI